MNVSEGMTVWLKTGSPAMVAKFGNTNYTWTCSWFDKNGHVHEQEFTSRQLTDINPGKSSSDVYVTEESFPRLLAETLRKVANESKG